ncbi:hypothetical protein ACRJ4W_31580, partial [Streptomyces sp. GLT-R25]
MTITPLFPETMGDVNGRDHVARMMPTTACRYGGWAEIHPASGALMDKHPPGWSSARGRSER